jgi:hypothetical protein
VPPGIEVGLDDVANEIAPPLPRFRLDCTHARFIQAATAYP